MTSPPRGASGPLLVGWWPPSEEVRSFLQSAPGNHWVSEENNELGILSAFAFFNEASRSWLLPDRNVSSELAPDNQVQVQQWVPAIPCTEVLPPSLLQAKRTDLLLLTSRGLRCPE